jgi:hypothetical protein
MRRRLWTLVLGASVVASVAAVAALAATAVKPYVVPIDDEYDVDALFSVADQVPLLGDPSKRYRMVGIHDGLGAHANGDGTATLYMNHELAAFTAPPNPQPIVSESVVGGPKNRGAIVSQWILDADGDPIAGRRAYDWIFNENVLVGPAPTVENTTRAFSRFCSGSLAGTASRVRQLDLPDQRGGGHARELLRRQGWASSGHRRQPISTLPKLRRFA